MHIADLHVGMLGANGIVGGGSPLVVRRGALGQGRADTSRSRCRSSATAASNQGTFHESLNLAAIWNLPRDLRVREQRLRRVDAGNVAPAWRDVASAPRLRHAGRRRRRPRRLRRARGAGEAVARARSGGGPTLLECKTYRYYGHFEGDQRTVPRAGARSSGCRAEARLPRGVPQRADVGRSRRGVARRGRRGGRELVDEAVAEAKAADDPKLDDLLTDVYVSYGGEAWHDDHLHAGDQRGAPGDAARPDGRRVRRGQRRRHGAGGEGRLRRRARRHEGPLGSSGPGQDTPISESASSVWGSARPCGLRPICDLMFMDFMGVCMDQVYNQAAKISSCSAARRGRPSSCGRCTAPASADSPGSTTFHHRSAPSSTRSPMVFVATGCSD